MKYTKFKIITFSFFLFVFCLFVKQGFSVVEIDRFEYLGPDEGLSQNVVTSLLCDSKGFLWIGTMNGLNRYDGYNFKIYENTLSQPGLLTNNRVVSLWEDKREFIWIETYDGYYHSYNPRKEQFFTLPKYLLNLEEKYSKISCFYQFSENEIWLGSTNSGVYRLLYDVENDFYNQEQFLSRGQYSISNNDIRFIISDQDSTLYIGARNGLNILKRENIVQGTFYFQHYFSDLNFTAAAVLGDEVWFGTENNGLVLYSLSSKSFYVFNTDNSPLKSNSIGVLKTTAAGNLIIGSNELYILNPATRNWITVSLGGDRIDKIFEDYTGLLWVTSGKFGVQQINQHSGEDVHFNLTPENYMYLSDKERPFFFEDSNHTLWVCVHGGGLAQYQRESRSFRFYRNDPLDPKSISSNQVMCMAEDQSGTLWVGTGLQGGANKIIFKNQAFKSVQNKKVYDDFMENIIRAVFQDNRGNCWTASKGGQIIIFDKNIEPVSPGVKYPFPTKGGLVYNVYFIFQDSKGHIWLGSKGAGVAVSKQPFNNANNSYQNLSFYRYTHNPVDSNSVCNDNIYCIDEDENGRIWIGTYGGGICYSENDNYAKLNFNTVNTSNSNLSHDLIRHLIIDSGNTLWVATTFGLNRVGLNAYKGGRIEFETFFHAPDNPASISYNDIVHIFEDSNHDLWFGTFGGGVDFLSQNNINDVRFDNYSEKNGLPNNDVFGILEDNLGHIWFSTENGLSRFDPLTESFENFNKSNGLSTNNYSENTCCRLNDGRLVFGGSKGFDVVSPEKIVSKKYPLRVIFTNFQLFNKEMSVGMPGSPLDKSISYTEKIQLKHNQSSFSFEFAALNFLDKSKTQYAYYLDGFEKEWNYVGAERKAVYTNLKPGEYTLYVKAALWDGKWDNEATLMKVIITPPWWKTTLAYSIYLIVFFAASLLVSRIVLKVNSFRNELKVEKAVNEVKLKFFTNISHEIRTPLTLILGPIEDLLFDSKFPEEFRPPLEMMQKNGKRMLHLLNQLLDFRKVQNKKMVLKVAPVNLVEFTRGIYENFVPHANHKNVKIDFTVDRVPENVWADPHRLDSVIFNVLSNAFKFTPPGKVVSVAIDFDSKASEAFVKVKDCGPGIKNKDIPLVFNRYSILSGESFTTKGTGIGLNLSNEIIKMHGGEIRVESEPGKGCMFSIVLKTGTQHLKNQQNIVFVENDDTYTLQNSGIEALIDDTKNDQAERLEKLTNAHDKTILIVEDNQQILDYISEALSVYFSVIKATDGKEGLEAAKHHHPDLIISDIMMPEIDGIEMTRILKASFDTCHIPVILLTAKSGIDDQILGIESGAEAYILKPFNMGLLKTTVANMLEQRNLVLVKYRDKREIEVSDIKFTSRDQEFIEKLIAYIEKNYSDPDLSINKLVEFSCVSRTVFYNKVKSLTGLSPIELMRQVRLKISAQMLLNGYNVNEAAINIGFNDTRYFSKQFKELFGVLPSQYKKSQTEPEEQG
ncbi:MAG: response regulator [Prolixibacteraceae bacterium]|nr:response regulator [Prolixibacteraceae bacterium]